jgi:signal transduction histidine kinase
VPQLAARALEARVVVLRLLDAAAGSSGVAHRYAEAGEPSYAGVEERLADLVRRERIPVLVKELATDRRFPALAAGETGSALCVPLVSGDALLGTLSLFGGAPDPGAAATTFGERDLTLLGALATQAAIAIDNARLFTVAQQRNAELSALREIGQAMTSQLDLSAVLDAVVTGAIALLGSQFAQVLLWDERSRSLRYGAAFGPESERVRRQSFAPGRGINMAVAAERRPVILDDYQSSPYALPEFPDVVATITTPVIFGDRLLGVLHCHTTEPGKRFRPEELQLLEMLGTQAAIAIENAHLFQEKERMALDELVRLRKISVLGEIGGAMQGTMRLDALLQVILTGVTYGGGLGFNRAILLLLDESGQQLVGRIGVGPSSGEEAARIWSALTSQRPPLAELIADRAATRGESELSAFDRFARSLVVPLTATDSLLVRTALEARPFRVQEARRDPRVHPQWEGRLDVDELACAPLIAKGAVVGVLAVDNKFNGKAISEEDLDFLAVFASQAGLALENARVYGRLEEANRALQRSQHALMQRERLAALGEMAAHVVHEIRNPLVAIGGFARRLTQRLSDREPEGHYAQIIAREVDRLERIVRDVRGLSRQVELNLAETDLGGLLRECLVLFAEKMDQQHVRMRADAPEGAVRLQLDPVQMKQAVVNLIANALEAMPEGGTLSVDARPAPPASDADPADSGGILTVGDTGGGIPEAILPDIFNPFVTSREAGTGLGLTVVRRIVRAHGGRVEVDNSPGEGATFRLWLPTVPPPVGCDAGREVGR